MFLVLIEGLRVRVLPAEKIEKRPSARVASNFCAFLSTLRIWVTFQLWVYNQFENVDFCPDQQ